MLKKLSLVLALLSVHISMAEAASLTGQLKGKDIAGYKVLAINLDGSVSASRASARGVFSLKPKKAQSLHLVDQSGRYAGPIVCPKGKKAFTRLSGKGGKLGRVKLQNGFATAAANTTKLFSRTSLIPYRPGKGPLGAGNLGLVDVPVKATLLSALAEGDAGDDKDHDGLPNNIDVNAGGTGKLDATNGDSLPPPSVFVRTASTLRGTLQTGLNAHFSEITTDAIDAALRDGLILGFGVRVDDPSLPAITAVNVDCLGVSYCTAPDAAATIRTDALRDLEGSPWLSYDPDGDGLPNLASTPSDPNMPFYVGIRPKVGRGDLHLGDTILFKLQTAENSRTVPVLLPFFFVTVPALKEYSSGANHGSISYPATTDTEGSAYDKPILLDDPSVTLTIWRPQRESIGGAETGSFIDIGHLNYKLTISAAGSQSLIFCEPGDFSQMSSTLELHSTPMGYAYLTDTAEDVASESGAALSFTFNAETCLARHGAGASGQRFAVDINADTHKGDQTSQTVWFQLK